MSRRPFYESAALNPFRRPCWRWDRANDLLSTGRNYSRKRDDPATGIAVLYLREIRRCLSDLRLRRVKRRFRHVDRAHEIWNNTREQRLELETRILARQTDTGIGLAMKLPRETIQAYRDLHFSVDDRIDATGYILFQVIGMDPTVQPDPVRLMQTSAWLHGSHVIEPWLAYCRGGETPSNLETSEGRQLAWIDLCLATHRLPDTPETRRTLLRSVASLFKNDEKLVRAVSARQAFHRTTARLTSNISFPAAQLPEFSYAPAVAAGKEPRHRQQTDRKQEAA